MYFLRYFIIQMFLCLPVVILAQTKATSHIKNIEARLFYNQDKWEGDNIAGTFSPNIIDNEEFPLWNTIIGGGAAKANSHQTFVIITIEMNGSYTGSPQILKLSAIANRKLLLQQNVNIQCYGGDRKTICNYCFVINDTGCDPLTLKAELIRGKQVQHTLTKTIDFRCGE